MDWIVGTVKLAHRLMRIRLAVLHDDSGKSGILGLDRSHFAPSSEMIVAKYGMLECSTDELKECAEVRILDRRTASDEDHGFIPEHRSQQVVDLQITAYFLMGSCVDVYR